MRRGLLAVCLWSLAMPALAQTGAAVEPLSVTLVGPQARPAANLICRVSGRRLTECTSATSPQPDTLEDARRAVEEWDLPDRAGPLVDGAVREVRVQFLAYSDVGPLIEAAPVYELPPPVPTNMIANPRWLARPTDADYERYFPRAAWAQGVEGAISLDCLVDAEGRLSCQVMGEHPVGMGFGEAAVRISRHFRMAPQTAFGQPTAGGRYRLRIPFRLTEPPPSPSPPVGQSLTQPR